MWGARAHTKNKVFTFLDELEASNIGDDNMFCQQNQTYDCLQIFKIF